MIFILILVVYVAVTYRQPLGPLPENLQWGNPYGLAAIAVMPISLTSATLFSEAMWQRYAAGTPEGGSTEVPGNPAASAVTVTCACSS